MKGLSHLTFMVRDLARMAAFMCDGLGAEEIYDSAGAGFSIAPEKFFLLGDIWIAVMQGEPPATRSYQHVAFAVEAADIPRYRVRLQALGVDILPGRARVEGEGQSLYFYDFDNHLFELHSGTLAARMERYRHG